METWNNFFWPVDLVLCIACVPMHVQKAFNFELWFYKKSKGGIETRIKFISMYRKTKLGNPL